MVAINASQKALRFDFSAWLMDEKSLRDLEQEPGFRHGSLDELDRIFSAAVHELKAQNLAHREDNFIDVSVVGRAEERRTVYLAGNIANIDDKMRNKLLLLGDLFNTFLDYFGLDWTLGSFVNLHQHELEIYSDRKKKSENAPSFLKRVYADELAAGSLTLSDLKERDQNLWRGLRNWAHAGGHDLDSVIPRGRTEPGRPREELGFDASSLNPDDPVHVAALKLIRKREADRLSAARGYQTRKKAKPPTP